MRKRPVVLWFILAINVLNIDFAQGQDPVAQGQTTICGGEESVVGCEGITYLYQYGTVQLSRSKDRPEAASQGSLEYVQHEKLVPNGGPNGETCVTTGYREVPPGAIREVIASIRDNDPLFFKQVGNLIATYPACPTQAGSAAVETRRSLAVRFWQDVPLPEPDLQIQPGRAITGKFAYLETRGSTSHTFTQADTPFGPLEIVATGAYYVDWGDGSKTGPHAYEGGPWPGGRIKHEYLNVGSYDVVVTERWTATWHFGAASGTLSELRTTGRIEDFPVEQIQVVRYR